MSYGHYEFKHPRRSHPNVSWEKIKTFGKIGVILFATLYLAGIIIFT